MWFDITFMLASYFLGSLPHLVWLAKLCHVRLSGDFHQHLWHSVGKGLAVVGVLGEFAKGTIPVLVGRWLGLNALTLAGAGLAAVCGQMWPVFNRFDGEKGNSIAIAMVLALATTPALVALVFPVAALIVRTVPRLRVKSAGGDKAIIGGVYSRSLPVGMALYFLALPFLSWYFDEPPEIIWGLAVLFVLMIIIRRMTAGLKEDLRISRDLRSIVLRRLLYDRSKASWRS